MCFSATASFSAAAFLIPFGVYTAQRSVKTCPAYLGFSIFPIGFGLQQLAEGINWLLLPGQSFAISAATLGFLFFSHFFWLLVVPAAAWLCEGEALRKKILFSLMLAGGFLGFSFFIPLLVNDGWFSATIRYDAIYYSITKIYDGFISTGPMLLIYVLIILVPLLVSSKRDVRIFGILLGLSMIVGLVYFKYAFVSIWCYFAAMLSCSILFIILRASNQTKKTFSRI